MFKTRLASLVPALVVAFLLSLAGSAHAQRVAKMAPQKSVTSANGVRASKWTANGTRFEHRTHGNSKIGWERRATGKDGTTHISGKLWGNKIEGTAKGNTETVTATSPTGQSRKTTTTTASNGTVRRTIEAQPEGTTRKITTWRAKNTRMEATRDYDASGKMTSSSRTGSRAE